MVSEELLAILACPACDDRPPLKLEGEFLVCTKCGRKYPIVDDIPHLLVEEAIEPPPSPSPASGGGNHVAGTSPASGGGNGGK